MDSIIETTSRQISYLRKLKYQLPQIVLNKLYCTYVRPILEYTSDGYNITDSTRPEQAQLNAA